MSHVQGQTPSALQAVNAPSPSGVLGARVAGIDTLRFFLATWVALGHLCLPELPVSLQAGVLGFVLRGVTNNLVSGPAAVVVFFVLSGFCIHYPHRHLGRLSLLPYFARRHIRIWFPVAGVLVFAWTLGTPLESVSDSVLWSLICEEVYYLIYPALLPLARRTGWPVLAGVSLLLGYAMVIALPNTGAYPSYGWKLNWVLGLPCWLLGAQLAETASEWGGRVPSAWTLGAWRALVLMLSGVCSVLRFHSPLTYPWTLNLFAVVSVLWLQREIASARLGSSLVLERAGLASYSIYLLHPVLLEFAVKRGWQLRSSVWVWCLSILGIWVLSALFYFVVERPSHFAARWMARELLAGRAPTVSS